VVRSGGSPSPSLDGTAPGPDTQGEGLPRISSGYSGPSGGTRGPVVADDQQRATGRHAAAAARPTSRMWSHASTRPTNRATDPPGRAHWADPSRGPPPMPTRPPPAPRRWQPVGRASGSTSRLRWAGATGRTIGPRPAPWEGAAPSRLGPQFLYPRPASERTTSSSGTVNQNRAPPPSRLPAPNVPPWARTALATVASPRPDPGPVVRVPRMNGSNSPPGDRAPADPGRGLRPAG
jgi:hypothetical protein